MTDLAIATEQLTCRFGTNLAVDHLDLQVPAGSVFGFIGRNGAGKTTTIRLLLNLLRPESGQARVLGLDPVRDAVRLKQRVGYVPDTPRLYDWMTVGQLIRFTAGFYADWSASGTEALLRRFGLDPGRRVKHLSRGMAAQLSLVLALGPDPELLILDEPSTGLDVVVRRDVLASIVQVIQDEGRTVFFSSHLVHEVERVADRVAVIHGGRLLACAAVDELKARTRKILVRTGGAASPASASASSTATAAAAASSSSSSSAAAAIAPAAAPTTSRAAAATTTTTRDLAALPGVTAVEGSGPGRLLTVTDFGPQTLPALRAAGLEVVEVVDLGLEDAFVSLVRQQEAGGGTGI